MLPAATPPRSPLSHARDGDSQDLAATRTARERLLGIDTARAIALLGMFTAHLVDVEHAVEWGRPETWWSIAAGRSSVLFAVLAGVSLALVTGRRTPVVGVTLTTARRRIALRGVFIAVLGILLMLLDTPVAVILPTYGVLFLVMLPALAWTRQRLIVTGAVTALVAMPAYLVTIALIQGAGDFTLELFGVYPLVTFAAYLLLGLAIGRSDLTSRRVVLRLGGLGTGLALAAYVAGEAVTPGGRLFTDPAGPRLLDLVFASEPHSSTLVDVVGSAGIAMAAISACCLLAVHAGIAFRVLAAIGSMPLSIYVGHLVVIAVLEHSGILSSLSQTASVVVLLLFVAAAAAFALLWPRRRGPLEAVLARVTSVARPATTAPRT